METFFRKSRSIRKRVHLFPNTKFGTLLSKLSKASKPFMISKSFIET